MVDSDALYNLCFDNPAEAVEFLVNLASSPEEVNALVQHRNQNGATPLFVASQNGHSHVVEALLAAGAEKEASLDDGRTSLYVAAFYGHQQVAEVLLAAGADKDAAEVDKWTPLHIASQNGHHKMVAILLAAGANMDLVNDDSMTPLHLASSKGHFLVVEELLVAGANMEAVNNLKWTPLHCACSKGYQQVVDLLLQAGADRKSNDILGATPLYIASQSGHPDVVKTLLAAGADIEATNKIKWTPLYIASFNGHHQVVEALLAAGANKDASNTEGATPLYIASQNAHHLVVEALLVAGVNKDAANNRGETPLYISSEKGHNRVVEVLLAVGAATEVADNDGWTSLYVASRNGHHQVVEMLLAAGADKDGINNTGRTPLQVAAERNHHLVVLLLLSIGADKSQKFDGKTPLDIARRRGYSEVVALLSSPTRPPLSPLIAASLTSLNRVKLMVVGRAAVGKTTLMRALFGKQLDAGISSTDGIDLGQFTAGGIEFMTWDFGGQKVYRYTHQLFLSGHAVYLVLFKASDPVAESVKEVRFWLNSISARISNSMVLLVGTHVDKMVPAVAESRAEELSQVIFQEYPSLVSAGQRIHVISAYAASQPAFKSLFEAIVQAGQSVNFPAPKNYASALSYLTGLQLSPPVIELRTIITALREIANSELHILRLLKAFHTLGLISMFPNEELPSRGVIVLRPQWIAKLLATIVTTRHSFVNKDSGVLTHAALVNQLWTDRAEFPPERHSDLIDLLVQLDIFFPVGQSEEEKGYFVPCMLREETPDVEFYLPAQLREVALQLHRVVELECPVPISVIPPIMVELMGCGELRARWQQGCVVRIPPSRPGRQDQVWLQLWRSGGRRIELKVWGDSIQTVTQWLRRVCSRIDSRFTEFYHLKYRNLIPCGDCRCADTPSDGHFDLRQLKSHIMKSHTEATCQPNGLHRCRLDMMVPDLLFLDLSSSDFIVPFGSLTKICELGQGAFGKVLKMSMIVPLLIEDNSLPARTLVVPTCSSDPLSKDQVAAIASERIETSVVAVKFLGEMKSREGEWRGDFFEEFKHEVYLMSSLDDPNVVKLSGICLHPELAMIIELMEGGDLYGQLHDPFRLRSRVFGLVKCINAAFFDFKAQLSFKRVFLSRDKLTTGDRVRIEVKIGELLTEPRADAIAWIQQQFDQDLRSVEFSRLNNIHPITDLGMTAEQLEQLGLPKPPVLATLGDGALKKARRAFQEWKQSTSVRGASGLENIMNWEQRFFDGVEELFGMWVADVPGNEIRGMAEQMQEIEDGIETLSREQALVVAPVDEALRLKLAIDVARGMLHLHELNPPIVHRDLKTPNVFLTRSLVNFPLLEGDDEETWRKPLAKVGDFGLSLLSMHSQSFQIRDRAEDDPLLNINATWAAPELLSGGKYSTPVDVYAMGILLWELLLRQHPFSEIPMHKIAFEVIAGQRPAIPSSMTANSNLQEYIELMSRCWHQNPAMRPSMREVYTSLRDICHVRCCTLATKLLPPPPPRAAVSQLVHDQHEDDTAPSVTSHSFSPSFSSSSQTDEVPRVGCILAPLKQQEVLWLGLESGHVALVDYRHEDPQRETLQWIQCQGGDKHQQRVTAISHLCRNSDEEGTVWTGSEDGGIHVWSPHLRSLEDIYDANTLKGRLEYLTRHRLSKKYAPIWLECEHGVLSLYPKRHDLKPIKSLPLTSIRSVSLQDSLSLSIVESSGKSRLFRQPGDDQGGCGVTDWHRVLSNILCAQSSSSRGITRLAAQRQSQQAILALEAMDHTVWSANGAFLLTEWGLDNTVDHHGLHRTMQVRPLRSLQLDGNKLEPARLRAIGGFVRVAASVLWVAVGDRWVVLDVTTGTGTWQDPMVDGMDKIAASFLVRTAEGKGQVVWTIDYSGRRFVWRCNDAENPELAGELVDEGWGEGDGRGYCMVQVGKRQVWMGTSQGRVLSWDSSSRHLVRQELQPLPASHPLAHSRSVHALVSIAGAQPPIVWSVSRDQTLRRFSW